MEQVKVIGFSGYARSGKDTAASFLEGWKRIAFADSLRDLAMQLNPYFKEAEKTYADLLREEGYENAKKRPYVRGYLIRLGEGVRTHIARDAWIRAAFLKIEKEIEAGGKRIVFTDVRYPNEAELIQKNGGRVVMIIRPGIEPAGPEEARSISEVRPDYVVTNDSTLEDLREKIMRIVDGE
jgi:hypothetical protein